MNSLNKLHCIALVAGCLALSFLGGCSQFGGVGSQNNDASDTSTQSGNAPKRVYSTRTAPSLINKSGDASSYADNEKYNVSSRDGSILADNYPNSYTVVRGDTLWDISARFLRDPWLWPEVWQVNQQIVNPHLIYPGDIITLIWVDGKPMLRLGEGSVRLSPKVRYEDLGQAIPTIPYEAIASFLSKPTVLDRSVVDRLPYILASSDGRLIMAEGNEVYARGNAGDDEFHNIMHIGDPYVDPETNYTYGFEATNVAEGQIVRGGDPFTILLTDTHREVLRGDRLLPFDKLDTAQNFYPFAAPADLNGSIISVIDGVAYIGQYNIVVLNRGANAGLEDGSVVSIHRRGESVFDPYTKAKQGLKSGLFSKAGSVVKLPDEPAGVAMVFRTYENLSYALVMKAEREIHEGDMIRSPE